MPACIPFYKYHALGNDYIVVNPTEIESAQTLNAARIQSICHRNFGVGSDGILFGPLEDPVYGIALRIFNPDGSEAEKSGNGLRIFARYLWEKRIVKDAPVEIMTAGGAVSSVYKDLVHHTNQPINPINSINESTQSTNQPVNQLS